MERLPTGNGVFLLSFSFAFKREIAVEKSFTLPIFIQSFFQGRKVTFLVEGVEVRCPV